MSVALDEKILRKYLLGSLALTEAELCDEASIVDDNFAAKLSSVENDLLDAYMRSELKGEELTQFEAHYLTSPLRRDKVIFARSFQTFAAKEVTPQAAKTATAVPQIKAVPDIEKPRRSCFNFF